MEEREEGEGRPPDAYLYLRATAGSAVNKQSTVTTHALTILLGLCSDDVCVPGFEANGARAVSKWHPFRARELLTPVDYLYELTRQR